MRMFLNCLLALVAVVSLGGIAQAQQFCPDGQCFGSPVIWYAPPPVPVYARPAYAPVYVVQDVPVITQEAAKPQTDTGGMIDEPTPEPPPRPPRPRPDYHFSPQCAPVLVPGPPVYSHCVPTPYRVRRSFGVGLTFHWNSSRR